MDEPEDKQQQNMVSNLPLLFANGYPTSLDKITEKQLENFIPFMVQCSLGHINVQGNKCSEPEWWPEDIPFTIPITKPKKFDGSWVEKMKEIVVICYQFHKSIFLLRFCYDLSAYEPARLRFINNYNSTTSLYDRRSNKLLVTFRNENMSYDQPQRNRKCLLLQKSRSQATENNNTQQMVEPALFDIYLCDNCDAELYSLEAITEHEKTCQQDDDVIICETLSTDTQLDTNTVSTNNDELQQTFLSNFGIFNRDIPLPNSQHNCSPKDKTKDINTSKTISTPTKSKNDNVEKLKRLPRRNRAVYALSRCPNVPLSSPAGMLMIKKSKTLMTEDYLYERLDRMERFCHAPVLSDGIHRPKFLDKKFQPPHTPVTFKKPSDQLIRRYTFPRRQFSNRNRNSLFLNSILLKRCRPISVRLKKLNDYQLTKDKTIIINSLNANFNIRLQRENAENDNWKITENTVQEEMLVDTIDLCSSDDDDDSRSVSAKPTESVSEITITTTATTTTTEKQLENNFEEIRKKSKFEGNFLVSQSVANQPKPLQPSVFLFSNYTTGTDSIHFHRYSSPNGIGGASGGVGGNALTQQRLSDANIQNQENLEAKLKKNFEDLLTSPNRTDRSNGKVIQLISCADSDVVINKINSPNRTISIDLTL